MPLRFMPAAATGSVGLSPEAVIADRQAGLRQLLDKQDELNNETRRVKDQLNTLHERKQAFIPTQYRVDKGDDETREVAKLEAELEAQEEELQETALTRKTYELITKRLRDEEQLYSRDLGLIDHHVACAPGERC